MGNAAGSLLSGLGQALDKVLGHPLEFMSGKSCNSVCAPTWDFICYIENFCVAQLLKFVMVAMLVYFVLLFLYLLYNLGICRCICYTLGRIVWACFSPCFSGFNFCCSYLCYKLRAIHRAGKIRRRNRRKRDIEDLDGQMSPNSSGDELELEERSIPFEQRPMRIENMRSRFSRRKNYKGEHLRRSLRPTNHRVRVELSGHLHGKRALKKGLLHDHIRVSRSSKFSQKGSRGKNGLHLHPHRRR